MPAIPTIPVLRTDDGGNVHLGRLLGSGGEARIFEIFGRTDFVAKVYHQEDPARNAALVREKEAKVRAMLARPPDVSGKNSAIAWPLSGLRSGPGFVGFLMPRAKGNILFRYHNPKERRKHSPNFDWFYLHRTAHNLSAIVDSIHRAGHVIADMNDQNFLVQDSALVAAVDTDSFQIMDAASRWHLCSVGRPEFTPPELQGKSFATQARGPEQDRFGLAVMIFQLLMEGSHPFRARLSLPHSVPEAQLYCIQHGHFPYHPTPGSPASPPPGGLDFGILHPLLQNMFRRCFIDGHREPARRPSAGEWRDGLKRAEADLIACPQGHKYRLGLAQCPWCARSKKLDEMRREARPRPPVRPAVLPTMRRPTVVSTGPGPTRFPRRIYTTPPPPSNGFQNWGAVIWFVLMVMLNLGRCSTNSGPRYSSISTPDYDLLRKRLESPPFRPLEVTELRQKLTARYPLQHEAEVTHAEFGPDGKQLLTTSRGSAAKLWEPGRSIKCQLGQGGEVLAAAFSLDGDRVVTASADHTAKIWNTTTFDSVGRTMKHDAEVVSAVFSPDGSRIVTASWDHTAQVWSATTGRAMGQPLLHSDRVLVASFSPDGRWVVTACADGNAQVWDVQTGRKVSAPLRHGGRVNSAVFSPDGSRVLTASADRSAKLWDAESGGILAVLEHDGEVFSAAFSPQGQMVVTACADHFARLWRTSDGAKYGRALEHRSPVLSAVFSPDGRYVATACIGEGSRLWDLSTRKPIADYAHGDRVNSVAFDRASSRLLTAGADKLARVWQIEQP